MSQPAPVLDQVVEDYLTWCRDERSESPHTIRRRRTILASIPEPVTVSREDLEDWWHTRFRNADGTLQTDATRANALTIVRTFYRWCQVWEVRVDDPSVRIVRPKTSKRLPRPASRDQLRQVLAALEPNPLVRRAVCLGAFAGFRVSEAAALHWSDIDVERRVARVLGKGRKERDVKLSAGLLEQLGANTGANVVTGTSTQLSADALRQRVNRAAAAAGFTSHQLRHYFGTTSYRATKDLVAVGKAMGHASVTTTQGYAQAADEVADLIAESVIL